MDGANGFDRLRPREIIGGEAWYALADVLMALHMAGRSGAACRALPAAMKRRVMQQARDWKMKRHVMLVSRAGVERLAIRYGAVPLHDVRRALDGAEALR